jgi:Trm5-related predicted tRNA methylase
MSLEMQNHTQRLQSSLINQNKNTMRPYLHDEICKITHTHRSCSQVVDFAAHGHRTSSIFADGLEIDSWHD